MTTQNITLGATATVLKVPSTATPDETITFVLTQDATGGRTATFNGAPVTLNAAANSVTRVEVENDGSGSWDIVLPRLNGTSVTTAPAAGGAGALPATPLGYLSVLINGTARKIAYYA